MSLPINSSISSKHMFIVVSSFSAKKRKNHLNPYTFGSIFHTALIQRSYAPPQKGPKPQIPHSLDTESSQVPEVCLGR